MTLQDLMKKYMTTGLLTLVAVGTFAAYKDPGSAVAEIEKGLIEQGKQIAYTLEMPAVADWFLTRNAEFPKTAVYGTFLFGGLAIRSYRSKRKKE
ncbi:hypothetical protein J4468_04305 [Candidatus Woesearchaeota archaeon]|nr:hypothetical protein [Candidatus Woesearchaeota archaeon]